jgi:hypothetical protein
MKQTMENIEELKIQPIFSDEFILELDLQLQDGNVSEPNAKVLKDIQRAIANYTYSKYCSDAREKQNLDLLADQYVAKALKYMEANIEDFPTFEATEQYVSTRTTVKTFENEEDNNVFVFGG